MSPPEQGFYGAAIQVASEFVDKGLPGRRQVKSIGVVEYITIMALLPILALPVEERLKEGEIRHIRRQLLESLLAQKALWVKPRVSAAGSEKLSDQWLESYPCLNTA